MHFDRLLFTLCSAVWGAGIHQSKMSFTLGFNQWKTWDIHGLASPAWVVVDGCLMLFVIELPPVKPQFGKDKLVKITMITSS